MRRFFKLLFRTLLFIFLFLLVFASAFIAYISFFKQNIPSFVLERISEEMSNESLFITVGKGKFRLFHSVELDNIRVFNRKKTDLSPILQIEKVEIACRTFSWPVKSSEFIRDMVVTKLKYPRLPDGYYIPDSIEFPGRPNFMEVDAPLELDLPEFLPFSLTLIEPEILGLTPHKVEVQRVASNGRRLTLNDILIHWPDMDTPMKLTGGGVLDLDLQYVKGKVEGLARQHNIRPMLTALDIPNSYQFIDGFTDVAEPVVASCAFDINLRKNDLHLSLFLDPESGRYNGVRFSDAQGPLDIRVFVRDTYQNAVINVGPLDVSLADGTKMSGLVIYENTNDVGFVTFDVESTATLSNALAIADIFTDGTLDCIQPGPSPKMTLKGVLAVKPENARLNNLTGSISFDKGMIFGIPLRAGEGVFTLKGTDVTFHNARASALRGGDISGWARISIPEMKQDNSSYNVELSATDIKMDDFGDIFKVDLGEKKGVIDGRLKIGGPLATNSLERVYGEGEIKIKQAFFANLSIFKGLVNQLVSIIPGLDTEFFKKASEKNDQTASCTFKIENGKFTSNDIVVEGSFISIKAQGEYDMINDVLDFKCNVRFFKNKSFMAILTRPFTSALSNHLLEFRVKGSLDAPDWKYVSPFDFN